jgi:hypothetical protein
MKHYLLERLQLWRAGALSADVDHLLQLSDTADLVTKLSLRGVLWDCPWNGGKVTGQPRFVQRARLLNR